MSQKVGPYSQAGWRTLWTELELFEGVADLSQFQQFLTNNLGLKAF